jgi:hypothetical protein
MRTKLTFLFYITLLVSTAMMQTSCKKKFKFSKQHLSFSADTIFFDTVFTTIGSTTKNFKFYNNDNNTLLVESIELMGGSSSPFRINVDGYAADKVENIEIEGGDSLYVFVEVTLDPNNGNLPMVIEDRIRFRSNGKDQYVQLVAWGQDAYFHYSYISEGILDLNEGTWPNDKPHVIYGAAFIDSAKTLNIQAGTYIYMHKNAFLYNYKGTLNILGSQADPVTFQGDRLEPYYDDVAGQYYGIYFQEARSSVINYAHIKNGTSGIHLFSEDPGNTGYTLEITNSQISNCARYGVFIYSGAKVKAENCIIDKNGVHALLVLEGGDFNFNHCNLLGYSGGQDAGAAVGISNYFVDQINGVTNVGSIDEGTITNSVIYGDLDYELAIDTIPNIAINLNFNFSNNLIRSETIFTSSIFSGNIWNMTPLFKNLEERNYTLYSKSPMNDAGNCNFPITNSFNPGMDIVGNPRKVCPLSPDIGAYEY